MIYSIDDLKAILRTPIDTNKWGDDTKTVISIIRTITSASCSSCAFRRHVRKLKDILNKYGDDIQYTQNSYAIRRGSKQSDRIPCTDCVAKHINQAYILQSEFYQGYTDYLSLIEGHLTEALEECPQHMHELRLAIREMLASVVVDRNPAVELVEFTTSNESDTRPINYKDTESKILTTNIDYSGITGVPNHMIGRAIRLLTAYCNKVEEAVSSGSNDFIRYRHITGYLAQASEFIARYSPSIADSLRSIRLSIPANPHAWDADHILDTSKKCSEIIENIKDIISTNNPEK